MSVALQSMLTQQSALDVVANNVANVNTPGYSREIANLEESPPVLLGTTEVGTGVELAGVESVRDNILNLRIDQENSQQSSLNSYIGAMNQVQALFNETQGTGLQTYLTNFFNSFQALAANPTSTPDRQAVISAGQDLADAFNQTSSNLSEIQQGLNQSVVQSVEQINTLTSQIAGLNQQIQEVSNSGNSPGSLEDERDTAINNLSSLVDVAVVYSSDGTASVSTTNGLTLVEGNQSNALSTQLNAATGMNDVDAGGSDVTSQIAGGQLQGLIEARDQSIPATESSLDNLAASLISAVNSQQNAGFDLNGAKGADFFTPFTPVTSGSSAGAASTMSVAITDPNQIAASSTGAVGDSNNATALANIQNEPLVSGLTIGGAYSNLIDQVGNDVSNATSEQQAVGLALQQLTNQQASISGVSLDEEATNLIMYQRAYEASARMISVADELALDTINIIQPGT